MISDLHRILRISILESFTDNITSGYLTSPNYPNRYPHRMKREWPIKVPPGQSIEVEFLTFSVEKCDNCG